MHGTHSNCLSGPMETDTHALCMIIWYFFLKMSEKSIGVTWSRIQETLKNCILQDSSGEDVQSIRVLLTEMKAQQCNRWKRIKTGKHIMSNKWPTTIYFLIGIDGRSVLSKEVFCVILIMLYWSWFKRRQEWKKWVWETGSGGWGCFEVRNMSLKAVSLVMCFKCFRTWGEFLSLLLFLLLYPNPNVKNKFP